MGRHCRSRLPVIDMAAHRQTCSTVSSTTTNARPEQKTGSTFSHPARNRRSHNRTRAANVAFEASWQRPKKQMRTVLSRNRQLPVRRPSRPRRGEARERR
jgi:hypothetical protein